MDRVEALHLVGKLADAYGPMPPRQQDLYADELQTMPSGPTGTAVLRLIRSSRERPSIAAIRAELAAVQGPTPQRTLGCERCGGSGWDLRDGKHPLNGTRIDLVVPCGCETGRRMHDVADRCIRGNA